MMIKQLAISVVASALFVGSALAQSTPPVAAPTQTEQPAASQMQAPAPSAPQLSAAPKNPDECIEAASSLAESAEAKKLAENKLDRIEELLVKMETHCDAKQFPEAMAVANDIKAMIETN